MKARWHGTISVVVAGGLAAAMPASGTAAALHGEAAGGVNGEVLVGIDQDLYRVDAATGVRRRLTTTGDYGDASYSPDGRKIAYMRWVDGAWPDLWVMNADGTNRVRLTNTPGVRERNPHWSPDGTQLVFEYLTKKLANPGIAVMRAQPGAPMTVVRAAVQTDACPSGQAFFDPTWTVKNQFVAGYFCSQIDVGNSSIAVFSRSGKLLKSFDVGDTFQLDVDPTGTRVVHLTTDGNPQVAVLNLQTGSDRVLTPSTRFSWLPIYSPDGASIAWQYANPDGTNDTFVMNADGSNKRVLMENPDAYVHTLDWRASTS